MIADIAIFDAEKVTDKATYEKGTLPSVGIPYVVVNGTIVVKDSKVLKGVNPGQPIRFESEKSRFEPITIEHWAKTLLCCPDGFRRRYESRIPVSSRGRLAMRGPPWRLAELLAQQGVHGYIGSERGFRRAPLTASVQMAEYAWLEVVTRQARLPGDVLARGRGLRGKAERNKNRHSTP